MFSVGHTVASITIVYSLSRCVEFSVNSKSLDREAHQANSHFSKYDSRTTHYNAFGNPSILGTEEREVRRF